VGRVHVEKGAAAAAHGARMAGGKRLANARAGHRALLVSMVTGGGVLGGVSGRGGSSMLANFPSWGASVGLGKSVEKSQHYVATDYMTRLQGT
jgi:hypothetical protein